MAARHLIVTDVFDGEGSWKQWIRHLGNAAAVNNWDDEAILKWLKVRLTGKAQIAFERLAAEKQTEYGLTALEKRFEPTSCQTRYQAQLLTHQRKKDEG